MKYTPSELQKQAGRDWNNLLHKSQAIADRKVIDFLRKNPWSDYQQIYDGCGIGVSRCRFLTWKRNREDGRILYCVNEKKLKLYLS